MTPDRLYTEDDRTTLRRILDLSWKISDCAPPVKPFFRFAKAADALYKGKTDGYRHFFWDFDDALQRILLGMARSLATPAEIDAACIERWKTNLEGLCQGSGNRLRALRQQGGAPQFRYRPRDEYILSRVAPGSRLLYVGCGAGTECLGWAQRGYDVVGIDTDEKLVAVANEWAEHLKLPFQAICMDARNIVLPPGSFAGFLLEFYGFQPSGRQALSLRKGLAHVLHEDGKGFIVATRKKYASFWYRMSNYGYPEAMLQWLKNQSQLDHCFSAMDACEEKLAFGLYVRSHTVDSLTSELGDVFAVQECRNEQHDPRYLIAVVKRKDPLPDTLPPAEADAGQEWAEPVLRQKREIEEEILHDIQAVCELLEKHQERLVQFYLKGGGNPLSMETPDLPRMIETLDAIIEKRPRHCQK